MQKNQNGFSAVLLILVLVIAGVIGAAAVYLKSTQPGQNTSANNLPTSPSPTADPISTDDWQTYSYPDIGIRLKAPKDWISEDSAQIHQVSVSPPTPFSVKTNTGDTAGNVLLSINIASPATRPADELQESTYFFSSTPLSGARLFSNTYMTLMGDTQSVDGPGVDTFALTSQQYTSTSTAYKPVLTIDTKTYEVWGYLYYKGDDDLEAPQVKLADFQDLPQFQTVRKVLETVTKL